MDEASHNKPIYLPLWLAVLLVVLMFAESGTRDPEGFSHIDSDHDGYVTRVEARSIATLETRFETADVNKDGLLDRNEYVSLLVARL